MSRETPCPWLPVSHPVPQTPHTSLGQQFRSGPYTGPTYLYGPLERCAPRRAYEHCAAAGQAAGAYLIMSLSSRPNPIAERPRATLDDAADAPPSEISSIIVLVKCYDTGYPLRFLHGCTVSRSLTTVTVTAAMYELFQHQQHNSQ